MGCVTPSRGAGTQARPRPRCGRLQPRRCAAITGLRLARMPPGAVPGPRQALRQRPGGPGPRRDRQAGRWTRSDDGGSGRGTGAPGRSADDGPKWIQDDERSFRWPSAPTQESRLKQDRKKRAAFIVNALRAATIPDTTSTLNFRSPLSCWWLHPLGAEHRQNGQHRDARPVRSIRRPTSWRRPRDPELEAIIHSTGFFRNKAKSLLGAARMVDDSTAARCRVRWRRC